MCLNHPDVTWYECGQSSFSGDALHLYNALDAGFLTIAQQWHAKPLQFSTFIEAKNLKKMDYLHSFPQHATFAMNLAEDPENLHAFKNGSLFNEDGSIALTALAPAKAMLTPAACYHIYIQLQNQQLQNTHYFTTANQCFRREAYYQPLERQWGFRMREIVCLGSQQDVADFATSARTAAEQWLRQLDLPVEWQIATDPFFDPSNSSKFLLQKIQPNKTEIVFDGSLAIGSLNLHRNYFGEIFNISLNDQPIHSSCLAFGVERWMAAILKTFGNNASNWPHQLREAVV